MLKAVEDYDIYFPQQSIEDLSATRRLEIDEHTAFTLVCLQAEDDSVPRVQCRNGWVELDYLCAEAGQDRRSSVLRQALELQSQYPTHGE